METVGAKGHGIDQDGQGRRDQDGRLEPFEQEVMESFPGPCLLPALEMTPAGLATAPAQFRGQVLPVDACLQDEDNPVKIFR